MQKLFTRLYLISILLILLPPFSLGIQIIHTHLVAKLIWIIVCGVYCFRLLKISASSTIEWFSIIILTQGISVVYARDILSFLGQFEDLFFLGLALLLMYLFKPKPKTILKLLLYSFLINSALLVLTYFFQNNFLNLGKIFLPESLYKLVSFNLLRSRLYSDTYPEIYLPLLFYLKNTITKNKHKLLILGGMVIIIFLALMANNRTGFLMLFFALISSLLIDPTNIKNKLIIATFIIASALVVLQTQTSQFGFNILDRLLIKDKKEDYNSLITRGNDIQKAIEIGNSQMLTGVGLGNYYLYNPKSHTISLNDYEQFEDELVKSNPHNIFAKYYAETGLIGLSALVTSLVYFVINDVKNDRKKALYPRYLTISFWTLFIFSLFNPVATMRYLFIYWILRYLIAPEKNLLRSGSFAT